MPQTPIHRSKKQYKEDVKKARIRRDIKERANKCLLATKGEDAMRLEQHMLMTNTLQLNLDENNTPHIEKVVEAVIITSNDVVVLQTTTSVHKTRSDEHDRITRMVYGGFIHEDISHVKFYDSLKNGTVTSRV
jgi:uncharacterized protein (UPF0212 family)